MRQTGAINSQLLPKRPDFEVFRHFPDLLVLFKIVSTRK